MTSSRPMSRAILILGMHRSGTSAITRVLNLLGVELGNNLMPAAAGNNENGFWEHAGVVEIHNALLHALNRSWHDLRPLPDGWLHSDAAVIAKAKLAALIESDFADAPLWAVKDPRLCRLLPLWRELLAELGIEPCAVMILRHPDEVARSLRDRDEFPLEQGRLLWLEHVADAERDSRGWRRCIVAYDDVLSDWRAALDRVGAELVVHWPLDPKLTTAAVDAFLDLGQRHHKVDSTQTEKLPRLIQDVYDAMRAVAVRKDTWGGLAAATDRYRSIADIFVCGFEAEIEGDHARARRQVAALESDAHERSEAMLLTLQEMGARARAGGVLASIAEIQPRGDSATLYWCEEEADAFDESRKVTLESARLVSGGRLVFRLPEVSRVFRLRIDPSIHPGRFDFLGLRIDQMLVENFAERVERVNQLRLPGQGAGHIAIVSMNEDPYVEVKVDDLAVDWSHGATVEVHVLRQDLPKVSFDEIWQCIHGAVAATFTRSIADMEQRSNALTLSMVEQLRVEEQTSRSDMLNRLEELLGNINAKHVEQFGVLGLSMERLLDRGDGHSIELAELRRALKAMDDERRRTLLQRLRGSLHRH